MKKLTLSLLSAAVALGAAAEVLTPAEALQRAGNAVRVAGKTVVMPTPVMTVSAADNQPALYVFDSENQNGYRILSADDLAVPVVGYADSGSFDPDNIPENMQTWLDFYAAEIAAAREAGVKKSNALRVARPERAAIAPICKTRWNQDAPYNNMCPKSGLKMTYTGCVATAMAQVLKTYEYPTKCSGGTYSYYADEVKKTISLNFDNVTLDWDNMLDSYTGSSTTEQKDAVANLMYAVAVAGQMDFGVNASGTLGLYMASGLVRNFGYDESMLYVLREWYTSDEWETMVYDQLAGGHAAYYDGSNTQAGHAFVVDGYQGDGYFHLNWGWGGVSDGYFLLSALDPSNQGIGGSNAGYNIGQGIMLNMKPSDGQTTVTPILFQLQGTLTAGSTTVNKGGSVTISGGTYQGDKGGFWNVSTVVPVPNCRLGIKFTPANGGDPTYAISTTRFTDMDQYYGAYNFNVTIPTALGSGTYVVTPVVRDGEGNNFDVMGRVGGFSELIATVAGTKVTFSKPEYAEVKASDIDIPETIYQGTTFAATFSLSNDSEQYYNGSVYAAIVNYTASTSSVSVLENSLPILVNLPAGESGEFGLNFDVTTKSTQGSRYFCLVDETGAVVSDLVPVTVAANPGNGVISRGTLSVTNKAQNNLTFKFTAKCSSGYYSNKIYFAIFENNSYKTQFTSDFVILPAGESKMLSTSVDFSAGVVGTKYQVGAYYVDANYSLVSCSSTVTFTLQEPEVDAIQEIEADNNAPEEYFDLTGRKVASPKIGSVYIKRQGDVTSKVYLK